MQLHHYFQSQLLLSHRVPAFYQLESKLQPYLANELQVLNTAEEVHFELQGYSAALKRICKEVK